jgi:hypothetical protein
VRPGECLVLKIPIWGLRRRTAAGMASVKVPPPWEREVLKL